MAWSDMNAKEKGMLVGTLVVFVLIGYMVYKLFFAGSSPVPTPVVKATAAQPHPAAANNSAASDLAVQDDPTSGAAVAANAEPKVVELPKRELTPEELNLLEERRQVQEQYLQLVNQYQLAEMQNKVATSQSTLLKTQIETAKSEQQATKLGLMLSGQKTDDIDKSMVGATLAYVGQKNGVWSAVLNLRGQYVTVKLGSRLSDNSLVSAIDDSGIVLYKDGVRRNLAVLTPVDQTSDDDPTPGNNANDSDN